MPGAVRSISTRLSLEGEKEYRAAIQGINTELANLDAQLRESTSRFAENANSVEALTDKERVLNAQKAQLERALNETTQMQERAAQAAKDHQDRIDELNTALEANTRKQEELAQAEGDTTEQREQLILESQNLQAEIAKETDARDKATAAETRAATAATDTQAKLNDLNREIDKNAQYLDEAKNSADGTAKSIDNYGNEVKDAGEKTSTFKDTLMALLSSKAVIDVLTAVGEAIKAIAIDMDEASAVIVKATGATGETLNQLNASARSVFWNTGEAESITDVADIIGELNTRLGLTGTELEYVAGKFIDYADVTGVNAKDAVQELTRVMRAYNLNTDDTVGLMDKLVVAAQKSGINVSTLADQLITGQASFQQLGYSLDDAVGLLSAMEYNGVNATTALTGLRSATSKLAQEGKSGREAINELFETIKNAKTDAEASTIAIDYFGERGGAALATALRDGRLELDEWTTALDASSGALSRTATASDTMAEGWQKLKNQLSAGVGDALSEIYDLITGQNSYTRALEEGGAVAEDFATRAELGMGNVADAVGALTRSMEDNTAKADEQRDKMERLGEAQGEAAKQILQTAFGIDTSSMSMEEAVKSIDGMITDTVSLTNVQLGLRGVTAEQIAKYQTLRKEQDNARLAMDGYTEAAQKDKDALEKLQPEVEDTTEALDDTADAASDAARRFNGLASTALTSSEDIGRAVDALEKDYKDAKKAAEDSLGRQMGLFDAVADHSSTSAATIRENWDKQREYYQNAESNLRRFSDSSMGVTRDLVQNLSDGSEESNAFIADFLKGYDALEGEGEELARKQAEYVADFNKSFEGMSEGRETFADELAKVQTEYDKHLKELSDANNELSKQLYNEYGDYKAAAEHDMQGLIDGINAKYGDVSGAVRKVQDRIRDLRNAMNNVGSIGSSSYAGEVSARSSSLITDYEAATVAKESTGSGITINVNPQSLNSGEVDRLVDTVNRRLGGARL